MITYQIGRLTEEERRLLDVASVAGGEFSCGSSSGRLVARSRRCRTRSGSIGSEGPHARPVRRRRMARRAPIRDRMPSVTFCIKMSSISILRRGSACRRTGAWASGWRKLIAAARPKSRRCSRSISSRAAIFRAPCATSDRRQKVLRSAWATRKPPAILPVRWEFSIVLARRTVCGPASRCCGSAAGPSAHLAISHGSVRDLKEMIACAGRAGELRQEVNGLLAVSRFCLHADRRACLQATEDVLAKSRALEDDTFKALVQGSSASINLYLKGWQEQDANLCVEAMESTADAQDHGTLIRRYGIEGILDCWRSQYQECRRSGTQGKRLAREAGDVYIFVLFNVLESTALIHLGEWRELQRETTAALELARRNANEQATALCRLTLAWLHVEAMDFEGARELCEGVDDKILMENQFAFFFQRAVLAKAFVGLHDPIRARKQFDDVQRRIDEDGIPLDFTIATQLYHCLGEYYLQTGEIEQARRSAIQLRDYVAAAPDYNHLAQACGLLARIALVAGDRDESRRSIGSRPVDFGQRRISSCRLESLSCRDRVLFECRRSRRSNQIPKSLCERYANPGAKF